MWLQGLWFAFFLVTTAQLGLVSFTVSIWTQIQIQSPSRLKSSVAVSVVETAYSEDSDALVEIWALWVFQFFIKVGLVQTCVNCVSYFSCPGGNTGIGKTTAIDLATRGARVILACRSKQRGEAAVEDIKRVSWNHAVSSIKMDWFTKLWGCCSVSKSSWNANIC